MEAVNKLPTSSPKIRYRNVRIVKHVLAEDAFFDTGVKPKAPYDSSDLAIDAEGVLTVKVGYQWDGASGPTIDTPSARRGALAHDALYDLMRRGVVSRSAKTREQVDALFYRLLLEDKMNPVRARAWYRSVRLCGRDSADPKSLLKYEKVLEAP